GIFKPSNSYIRTTNNQYLTIYFSDVIPNKIIVRNQGSSTGKKGTYEIVNNSSTNLEIVQYSNVYKDVLYKPNAIKFKDVKESTGYIDLDLQENYATNKLGEKIK